MNIKTIIGGGAALSALFATSTAVAQQVTSGLAGSPGASLTIQRVYGILIGLVCWLAQISLFVIVIALLFYGLMFFFSQGNQQTFGAAKTAFGWGIVGTLVILGSYTIVATVATFGGFLDVPPEYNLILAPIYAECSLLIF